MQLKAEVLREGSKFEGFSILGSVKPTSNIVGQHGYGFVYAFPSGILPRQAPASLFHIIKTRALVDLPLRERFRLAYKISSCVRKLHIAG